MVEIISNFIKDEDLKSKSIQEIEAINSMETLNIARFITEEFPNVIINYIKCFGVSKRRIELEFSVEEKEPEIIFENIKEKLKNDHLYEENGFFIKETNQINIF